MEKPDRKIFEHALTAMGIEPQAALMVGDNYYDDVVGARSVGMDAVLINRFGRVGIEEIHDCWVFPDVCAVVEFIQRQLAAVG